MNTKTDSTSDVMEPQPKALIVTPKFVPIDEYPYKRGGQQIIRQGINLTIQSSRRSGKGDRPELHRFEGVKGEYEASYFKEV